MNLQTDIDRNIVNFTIVSQANAEARARLGTVKHNVSTIDWLTKTMTSKSSSPGSSWNSGGFGAALKGMGMESFIPTNGRLPNTGIPEATPGTMANASDMIQLIVMTKVLGEPLLQAGKCVTFRIPAQVSTTGPKPIDEIVSGKFLMSKVRHQIGGAQNRPRYYTTVEGVKPEVGGVA